MAIAGTGLVGSSIGLRTRLMGAEVRGWDVSSAAVKEAIARGALDRGVEHFDALLDDSDVLVLAAPLDATLGLLDRIREHGARAGLIVDVASLKVPVMLAARNVANFVPTHPMAGGERSGPSGARAGLFEGATWAYVPGPPAATAAAVDWIGLLGARPLAVDAGEHDRAVALTSQLPQLVAVALAAQLDGQVDAELTKALCGPGIRSMTRLAGSSWTMWESLIARSDPALAQEVRRLGDVLAQVAAEIDAGSLSGLAGRFAAANRVASKLRANDGPASHVHDPSNPSSREVP